MVVAEIPQHSQPIFVRASLHLSKTRITYHHRSFDRIIVSSAFSHEYIVYPHWIQLDSFYIKLKRILQKVYRNSHVNHANLGANR